MRRFDVIALSVMVLLTVLWAIFPPSGRPQDLDLTVEVRLLPPETGKPQEVEATVRWERHRRWPALPIRNWTSCIAFSYDWVEWTQSVSGSGFSDGVKELQAAFGEPTAGYCLQVPDTDPDTGTGSGEYRETFVRRATPAPVAVPETFPLRVQFMRLSAFGYSNWPKLGWIRSVNGNWPLK